MTRKLLAATIAALALAATLSTPAAAKDITWGYGTGPTQTRDITWG